MRRGGIGIAALVLALGGRVAGEEAFLLAKENPGNARAWWRMGAAAFKAGRYKDAVRCWAKVDALEPYGKKVQLWIGWAAIKLGKVEPGVKYLRRALSLDPGHKEARRILMRLAGRGDIDPDEVAPWPGYPPAPPPGPPGPGPVPAPAPAPTPAPRAADPRDRLGGVVPRPDPAAAEAAFKAGREARGAGDGAAAVARLCEAYAAGYEREAVDFELGRALLEGERPEEAIFHLERARAASEEDQTLHLLLGLARGLQGDREGQLRALGRALELDPEYAEAHFHLTLAFDAVGNYPEAFRHAQAAVRLDPAMKERLKPRLKDARLAGELGSMVTRVLDASRTGAITDEQIEEWAEQVAQLIGAENLEGLEAGEPVSKDTVKDALVVLRDTRDARRALGVLPPETRSTFLKVVKDHPDRLAGLQAELKAGLRK